MCPPKIVAQWSLTHLYSAICLFRAIDHSTAGIGFLGTNVQKQQLHDTKHALWHFQDAIPLRVREDLAVLSPSSVMNRNDPLCSASSAVIGVRDSFAVNPGHRRVGVPLLCALVGLLTGCAELIGPKPETFMRPPTSIRPVVLVDSFYTTLPATPGGTVAMHYYGDPVYADVWVEGSIWLSTNPVKPGGYFGPVNTTNGPVYAGGSFVSGGGCGLNVRISYTNGVSVLAVPCNDASASWKETSLFQGTGTAVRGGAISEPAATCEPMPCHTQTGSQKVWIRPLPTELVLTPSADTIVKGSNVTFSVSANPNTMASGGGRPRRVTAWRWRRDYRDYLGPDTTTFSSYCGQTVQTCTLPIKETGQMSVDAIVNGSAQTKSVHVWVKAPPCSSAVLRVSHPIRTEFSKIDATHKDPHMGRDFGVPVNTPVYAPHGGTIAFAGYSQTAGYAIALRGTAAFSYFFHLASISVAKNQTVVAGDLLGYSGNTGNSTGPHLHFEQHWPGPTIWPHQRSTAYPPCQF